MTASWWFRLVRRTVGAALVVLLTAVFLVLLPISLVVAALVSPFSEGRWRPLRLVWIVTVQLVLESLVLLALLVLWLMSGCGWRIRRAVVRAAPLPAGAVVPRDAVPGGAAGAAARA